MFKSKKLSVTPILNHDADPSTNVVDESLDSSASTTLTPEVNIYTATAEATASTTLDASSSVPDKESRPLIIQNLLLLANLFSQLNRNMISPCDHLATEKSNSGSIVIGLKTKIGNPGYTTMQKKMQLFVLLE